MTPNRAETKLKIAHVTATFPPYVGGTGNVCYNNSIEQAKLGHEVVVFTAAYPNTPQEEVIQGVKVKRLSALFRFGNAPFLPGLLQLKGFDIIHLHHPFIFGTEMVSLVSLFKGIPFVLTHHNDLVGNGFRELLFRLYALFSIPVCFWRASRLGLVSIDYLQTTRYLNWFRKHPHKIVEFSNGVDVNLFERQGSSDDVNRQLGFTGHEQKLLFVGSLDLAHRFKRLEMLLESLVELPERVVLLVAGDGELRSGFESMAEELQISKRVRFLGSVGQADLPKYYSFCDVLVLPSTPPESFGLVVVESMACGTPVIASDIPGVRSLIRHGEDGYLFDPTSKKDLVEKINSLLENPKLAEIFSQNGYKKVIEQYSWEKVVRKLVSAYREVVGVKEAGN